MPTTLAHIPALPLKRDGPRLKTSAVNPPPPISAFLIQRDVLPIQSSSVRAAPDTTSISVLIKGRGGPPTLTPSLRAHHPILSAFPPQQAEPPLQPSALNNPPLLQILAFPLQRDLPPLQTLSACAPPLPIYVSFQGRGEPPLLHPTVHAYVNLLSALLLWKVVPLRQTLDETAPLPHRPALPLQRRVPLIQPLSVRSTPPLSILLQGIGVSPLIHSSVIAYAPLIW